jgi:indole-3-acetate monooxygenase
MRVDVEPSASALESACALAPLAADRAEQSERDRRLAPELVTALRESGLFRICVPRSLGGGEVAPGELVAVMEELGRADGSTAWCVAVAATSGALAAYMPEADARDVYGAANGCVGGVFAPMGRAVVGQGGYRVTGRWPFTSGVDHCDWLMGGCLVEDDGDIRVLDGGIPDIRLMLFPASEVEVIDTWTVSGLCGTGSHDTRVSDLIVPAGRSASLFGDVPREQGSLYAFPVFGLLALAISGVALGIARGAVDDLLRLAEGKLPTMQTKPLAAQADTQLRMAKAEARLRAARALVTEAIGETWQHVQAEGEVALGDRAALRMAANHAMSSSAEVVDEMYSLGGGTSIYANSPLQRRFRDVHTATQHVLVGSSVWQTVGRVLLGQQVRAEQL